jgi:hypothetical protein
VVVLTAVFKPEQDPESAPKKRRFARKILRCAKAFFRRP